MDTVMEDRELLIRVDERTQRMNGKMDDLRILLHERMRIQDEKIENLPQWRHVTVAMGTAFLSLVGLIIRILTTPK